MKSSTFVLLIILSVSNLNSQIPDSLKFTVLTPAEFHEKFQSASNAVLIDVRDFRDFKKSRIPGAINIPYPVGDEYFLSPEAIGTDKSLFIYCYAGVRSKKSALVFYQKGYRNIYSLEGGFTNWKFKKMPVERRKVRKNT
jgi:rhodanese-related sulfurtransferase